VWLVLLGLVLSPAAASSEEDVGLSRMMTQPGVKLIAVEFWSEYCPPCVKALPKWKELHQKYRHRGFRLILVAVASQGRCSIPDWVPDKKVCDFSAEIAKSWSATELPQAFLWTWQGKLLVEHASFEEVAERVEQWFEDEPRILVDTPRDRAGKPLTDGTMLRQLVRSELQRQGKFDLVMDEDEKEVLRTLGERSHGLQYDDAQRCKLGAEVSANSLLQVSVISSQDGEHLAMQLLSVEKGCLVSGAWAPISPGPSGKEQAVIEAVANLVPELLGDVGRPSEHGRSGTPDTTAAPVAETVGSTTRPGKLSVRSTPEGARVLVNGTPVGTTPTADVSLPAGNYQVRLHKDGYHPVLIDEVTIAAGVRNQISEVLEKMVPAAEPPAKAREPDPVAVKKAETPLPTIQPPPERRAPAPASHSGFPVEISAGVEYEFLSETSDIQREFVQSGASIVLANKLRATRTVHVAHLNAGATFFDSVSIGLGLPLVLADATDLGFHPDIPSSGDDAYNYINDIDPTADAWSATSSAKASTLFDVPFKGKTRGGLGNLGLKMSWNPLRIGGSDSKFGWTVGTVLTLPTGDVKRAENDAVGDGVFGLRVESLVERRLWSFFEPWLDLHYVYNFPTADSLFQKHGAPQTMVDPADSFGFKVGSRFVPWERKEGEQQVAAGLSFGMDYVYNGRAYTPLFEALGSSPCATSNGCYGTTYSQGLHGYSDQINSGKKNGEDTTALETQRDEALQGDSLARTDGITDVQQHMVYTFGVDVSARLVDFLELGAALTIATQEPHFLTFAEAGKDSGTDNDGYVTGYNSNGDNEYNPVYLEDLDQIGNRFKLQDSFAWGLLFSVKGVY